MCELDEQDKRIEQILGRFDTRFFGGVTVTSGNTLVTSAV